MKAADQLLFPWCCPRYIFFILHCKYRFVNMSHPFVHLQRTARCTARCNLSKTRQCCSLSPPEGWLMDPSAEQLQLRRIKKKHIIAQILLYTAKRKFVPIHSVLKQKAVRLHSPASKPS